MLVVGSGVAKIHSIDMTRSCHQAAKQENGLGTGVNEEYFHRWIEVVKYDQLHHRHLYLS